MKFRFPFLIGILGMVILIHLYGCQKSSYDAVKAQQTRGVILENRGWKIVENKLIADPAKYDTPKLQIGFSKYNEVIVAARSGVEVTLQMKVEDGFLVGMVFSSTSLDNPAVKELASDFRAKFPKLDVKPANEIQ